MTPPPADPLFPLSSATADRFLSTTPIDRVHRRDGRHEEEGRDRGHQHHGDHPSARQEQPTAAWLEEDVAMIKHGADTYDDHGRLAHRAEVERAAGAQHLRHFDGRA